MFYEKCIECKSIRPRRRSLERVQNLQDLIIQIFQSVLQKTGYNLTNLTVIWTKHALFDSPLNALRKVYWMKIDQTETKVTKTGRKVCEMLFQKFYDDGYHPEVESMACWSLIFR